MCKQNEMNFETIRLHALHFSFKSRVTLVMKCKSPEKQGSCLWFVYTYRIKICINTLSSWQQHHILAQVVRFYFFFIYLLTLFNVDYKTLAAYALIKIDYPPQKKHNENINKSVKEDNRMRIQFFQINPTCWMYVLHILHGHF